MKLLHLLLALTAALTAVLLTSCAGPSGGSDQAASTARDVRRLPMPLQLSYGADPNQTLALTLPKGLNHEPLLIFVHGGAWIGGGKLLYAPVAEQFSKLGLAVCLVDYRLSPAVRHPSHVEDVAKAYVYLLQHADRFGFDPNKIFVSGHSAGGHNAGMLATGEYLQHAGVPKDELPKGFIGLEGIYDLPDIDRDYPSYEKWFLDKAFGDKKYWPDASPSRRPVKIKAPWLLVQSNQDQLVNLGQAQTFADHLKKQGVTVWFYQADLGDHDKVARDMAEPTEPLANHILQFIASAMPK